MKVLLIILLVLAAGFLLYDYYLAPVPDVDIMARFDDKIVYTTDIGIDREPLKRHCRSEGGEFNTCGSVCETGAICIEVCALTCEFK